MSSPNIKHGADGNLLHGPHGHLVHDCGSSGCPCAGPTRCDNCPDATPTQIHASFVDVTLCSGCVSCDGAGISFQISEGSTINGTYLLTQNGDCAWTIDATEVPCAGTTYFSTDCSGDSTPIEFAVQLVRVTSTQFELQVTDESNTILLFNATFDAAMCCAGYTVANALTSCGCDGITDAIFALGTGGSATVTPC